MQKVLLTFLLGLLIMPNLNAQNEYENNLDKDYVVKLSFNIIDKFYENDNMTMFLTLWLDVKSAYEFEQIFPEFTNPENDEIRNKVFNGMITTFGNDENLLYGNLLGVTYDRKTALYWTDYLLKHYPIIEPKNNAKQENYSTEPIANENELYQETETTIPVTNELAGNGRPMTSDEVKEYEEEKEEPTNNNGNNGNMALPTSQTIYVEDKENDCKKTYGTICLKVFENQIAYSSFGSTNNDYCLIKLAISIVEDKNLEESVNKVFVKFIK